MIHEALFKALESLLQFLTANLKNKEYVEKMEQLVLQLQDQRQANIVRQLNEQFLFSPQLDDEAKKQIQQVLNLLGTSQKIQGTDEFFAEKQSKNAQGIGISIMDEWGRFVITDKETRSILESTEHPSPNRNIMEFCCHAARHLLSEILNNDDLEKEFLMTIYSEQTRKKAMKHLNSIGNKQLKQFFKSQEIKEKNQKKQKYNLERQIQLKYLKTLHVKLRAMKIKISPEFTLKLKSQNDLLGGQLLDQIPLDQTVNCYLCEMSISQSFQKIDLIDLQRDQKIKFFEEKWKLQCDQFRQSFLTGQAKKRAKISRKQSSMTELYQDQSFEEIYRLESNFPICN